MEPTHNSMARAFRKFTTDPTKNICPTLALAETLAPDFELPEP